MGESSIFPWQDPFGVQKGPAEKELVFYRLLLEKIGYAMDRTIVETGDNSTVELTIEGVPTGILGVTTGIKEFLERTRKIRWLKNFNIENGSKYSLFLYRSIMKQIVRLGVIDNDIVLSSLRKKDMTGAVCALMHVLLPAFLILDKELRKTNTLESSWMSNHGRRISGVIRKASEELWIQDSKRIVNKLKLMDEDEEWMMTNDEKSDQTDFRSVPKQSVPLVTKKSYTPSVGVTSPPLHCHLPIPEGSLADCHLRYGPMYGMFLIDKGHPSWQVPSSPVCDLFQKEPSSLINQSEEPAAAAKEASPTGPPRVKKSRFSPPNPVSMMTPPSVPQTAAAASPVDFRDWQHMISTPPPLANNSASRPLESLLSLVVPTLSPISTLFPVPTTSQLLTTSETPSSSLDVCQQLADYRKLTLSEPPSKEKASPPTTTGNSIDFLAQLTEYQNRTRQAPPTQDEDYYANCSYRAQAQKRKLEEETTATTILDRVAECFGTKVRHTECRLDAHSKFSVATFAGIPGSLFSGHGVFLGHTKWMGISKAVQGLLDSLKLILPSTVLERLRVLREEQLQVALDFICHINQPLFKSINLILENPAWSGVMSHKQKKWTPRGSAHPDLHFLKLELQMVSRTFWNDARTADVIDMISRTSS